MSGIELRLFGGASLQDSGGTPLAGRVAHRHRLALMTRLAMAAPGGVSRDKLVGLLWPERDETAARHLLRAALHDLRRVLGAEAIVTAGTELRLDQRRVLVDARSFEARLAAGELAEAVALYRGPFLDGFFLEGSETFEEWATAERVRLAAAYESVLERLATTAARRDDAGEALRWWQALASARPADGRVARATVEVLVTLGDPAGAVAHAVAHARWLRSELGIGPDAALTARVTTLRKAMAAPPPDEWFLDGNGALAVQPAPSTPAAVAPLLSAPAADVPSASVAAPSTPASAVLPLAEAWSAVTAAPVPQDAPAGGRKRNRRWLVGATLVVVIAGVALTLSRPDAMPATARRGTPMAATVVAVAPFTVIGEAPPELRDGLANLLSANLDQVADLRIVPSPLVLSSARGQVDPGSLLARVRAELLVTGVVAPVREGIAISARLVDGAGAVRARVEVRGAADDLSGLVDRLTLELLRELWGRRLGVPTPRLAAIATSSPAALRAFLRGEAFVRSALWDSAAAALAEAVDLDSTFALAHLRLAEPYGWRYGMGSVPSQRELALAARYADRLPPRERMLLAVRQLHEAGRSEALDSVAALAGRYPDDPEAQYVRADVRFHAMEASGYNMAMLAVASFDTAMGLDSMSARVFAHPLSLALMTGDSARFDRSARRLEALGGGSHVQVAEGWDYALLHALRFSTPEESVRRFVETVTGKSPPPFWQLAELVQAIERAVLSAPEPRPDLLLRAHDAARRTYGGDPGQGSTLDVRRATLLIGLGRLSAAQPLMARAWAIDPHRAPANTLVPVILGYAPPGWMHGARERLASSIYWQETPVRRRQAQYWRGMLALGGGDLPGARAAFRLAGRPAPAGEPGDSVDRGLAGALRAAEGWMRVLEGDSTAGIREVSAGFRQVGYEGEALLLTTPTRLWWARTLARDPSRRADGIDRIRGELLRNEGFRLGWRWLELSRALAASGDEAGAADARRRFDRIWAGADAVARSAALTMGLGGDTPR